MKEDNGELVKTIEVKATRFIFDSIGNIVLYDDDAKELNWFNNEGVLLNELSIENYRGDIIFQSLSKYDEPIFFDMKSNIV